jgi:hypothetical protein
MEKSNVTFWIYKGLRVGLMAGLMLIAFELVKYMVDSAAFYSTSGKLLYLLTYIIGLPLAAYLTVIRHEPKTFFFNQASMIFVAYLAATTMAALMSIGLHHAIDPLYRERIVDYNLEQIEERNREFEEKYNANVQGSTSNLIELRTKELANYEVGTLLMAPVKATPVFLIVSVIVGFIFTAKRKADANEAFF